MVRKAENLRLKAIRKRKIAARHARTRAQSNTKAQCVHDVAAARCRPVYVAADRMLVYPQGRPQLPHCCPQGVHGWRV